MSYKFTFRIEFDTIRPKSSGCWMTRPNFGFPFVPGMWRRELTRFAPTDLTRLPVLHPRSVEVKEVNVRRRSASSRWEKDLCTRHKPACCILYSGQVSGFLTALKGHSGAIQMLKPKNNTQSINTMTFELVRVCGTACHRTYDKTWTLRISSIN